MLRLRYPIALLLVVVGTSCGTSAAIAAPAQTGLCDIPVSEPGTLRCRELADKHPRAPLSYGYFDYGPTSSLRDMLEGESVLYGIALRPGRTKVSVYSSSLDGHTFDVLMRRGAPPTEADHELRCHWPDDAATCSIVGEGALMAPFYIRFVAREPVEYTNVGIGVNSGTYTGP